MKLKKEFYTHESDGQQVLIDTSGNFSGLARNNKTAAFIVNCLKEETNIANIVDAMHEKYEAPKDVIEKDVLACIEKLRAIGAIEE